jgi:hypothetical protein
MLILLVAKDKTVSPRSIQRSSPQEKLRMRVVELDEAEGTFVLERIED